MRAASQTWEAGEAGLFTAVWGMQEMNANPNSADFHAAQTRAALADPLPNWEQARDFLSKLDQIHLVSIVPGGPTDGHHFGIDVEAALQWSKDRNAQGRNVYWTINRVDPGIHKKPAKADITATRFAHVDIDPPKDGSQWDPDVEKEQLLRAPVPPSIINWSGNGWQALWEVEDADPTLVEQINRGLIACFRGDKGTHNSDRLFRVPGTLNYPDAKKRQQGRSTALSYQFQPHTGEVFTIGQLAEAYPWATPHDSPGKATRQSGQPESVPLLTADDLGIDNNHPLRRLIESPKGVDRSADSYACACEMGRRGHSIAQIEGILLNPENAVSAHYLDQAKPERAVQRTIDKALNEPDVERWRQQREITRRIGDGSDSVPTTTIYTLAEMIARFVFIKDGSYVADRQQPQARLSLADFKNTTAASTHALPAQNGPHEKLVPCAVAWLKHADRLVADSITFQAGQGEMATAPDGRRALNLWAPSIRESPPSDWRQRAQQFVNHVDWLFGEHATAFLDWLAHLEQQPGKLPHFGWIHVSRVHGKGRGWIAGVLARLWRGNVAASFDLVAALEGQFNDRLSRCLLAIVDEINEGGNSSFRHAQSLRQMVTAEVREINPKYGRKHVEWNSTRWLIFSNHVGAIPLDDSDRRFWVVDHCGPVREAEYYSELYGALDDSSFIASLAEYLRLRDITGFNPGARPPMTEAKRDLIASSASEADRILADVVERWPLSLITWDEIKEILGDHMPAAAASKHVLGRAGLQRLSRIRVTPSMYSASTHTAVYAVRNFAIWKGQSVQAIKDEFGTMSKEAKLAAYFNEGNFSPEDGTDLL